MRAIARVNVIAASALLVAVVFAPVSAGAAGEGQACGGFTGAVCDKGLWCDPLPGLCGVQLVGRCVEVPFACPHIALPVCGCNGKTYGNDCKRQRAKMQKAHDGPC